MVMVIDVDADKLTDPPCASKATEIMDEAGRETSETHDGSIHIDNEGIRAIDLCPSSLADI